MKAISFLGTANYSLTTFEFEGKTWETRFFSSAFTHFLDAKCLFVCTTPTVQKHQNLIALKQELHQMGVELKELPIPEGHREQDLWEIFDNLTNVVDENEELFFDVTNSFRSLPILALLAIAYLKTAKQVKVEQILYGAWEAKDENNHSPVFDLTPFVSLLDWLPAADQFIQTGDGRRLANMLNPSGKQKGAAANASQTLANISQTAILCQPISLMKNVSNLEQDLQKAEQELAQMSRPFVVIRDRVVREFQSFEADFDKNTAVALKSEFQLIEWYYGNQQLIQAMTLAREWLIDAVTYRLGRPASLKPEDRSPMERAISGIVLVGRKFTDSQTGERRRFTREDLNEFGRLIHDAWPEHDQLRKIWDLLSPLRNALDHAEHQANPMKLKSIIENSEKTMPLLRKLAIDWELNGT
jgi:hypothetical protein